MTRHIKLGAVILAFAATTAFVGCDRPSNPPPSDKGKADAHAHHDHGEEGPHHGHLIELGEEEFHAEIVHDDAASKVTIYLLDGKAKESASADGEEVTISIVVEGQPKDFALKATDAAKRDQFESKEPVLVASLDHEKDAKGRLQVTINKKPYTGIIEHEAHSHK
jgi:hypothetical protein